jgi:hypothetical protein
MFYFPWIIGNGSLHDLITVKKIPGSFGKYQKISDINNKFFLVMYSMKMHEILKISWPFKVQE